MAQGTDESRPEFPDNEKPLYTPDEQAQRQVVARIARAREGKHPRVSDMALGEAWGKHRTTAKKLAEHPEKLDPWQVRQLCGLCGVTLEWLRYGGENAYGLYETADTVAAMYSHLSNEDRTLVCDLLTRLLGADAVRVIKHEQWTRDNIEWLERHPAKLKELQDAFLKAISPQVSVYESIRQAVAPIVKEAMAPAAEYARAALAKYTDEERELMERTARELESNGANVDHMTADELLAAARGDSVEG